MMWLMWSMSYCKNKVIKKCEFFLGGLFLLYPLLIYYTRDNVYVSGCCLISMIAISIIRAIVFKRKDQLLVSTGVMFMIGLFLIQKPELAHLLYPSMVSLSVAAYFIYTLIFPPSAVEQIARLMQGDLDEKGIKYTRKVTLIWVLFCFLNSAISYLTVLSNNGKIWFLYNGIVSYILMGMLFVGEYLYRKWVLKP